MIIQVTVKPNSKKEGVEQLPDGSYRVAVNAPPTEGRANEALVEILAKHFSVAKSRIAIVRGLHGRRKVVEVSE